MKKNESIFTQSNFKFISITFALISLVLVIISNFKIESYVAKFILPSLFLIFSYIFLLKKLNLEGNKDTYYYLVPIFLILFSYFIIDLPSSNKVINVFIVPIVISIFLYSFTNIDYKLSRSFIVDFFKLFPNRLISNLDYLKLLKEKNKESKTFDNLVVGCAIGIPIALVLLFLLGKADKYFSVFVDNIFNFIGNILSIGNIIPNLLFFILMFIILFSVFTNVLRNRVSEQKVKEKKNINTSIGNIVLIIINSVFCLFLLSEISKLTINFLNIPVEYTYAMYAREGFFQLLFVTLINISIIIYFVYYTNSINNNKLLKKLIILLITFSILLIFNSYYRMFLYLNAYGFTVLRLQVILFLLMELLIFILILKNIVSKSKYNEVLTYFIVIITTYIINLYMCNQGFVDFLNNLFNINTHI